MGTSTSSKGPSNSSPLVPPWADIDGQGAGPPPEAQRFKDFRRSLGKYVTSRNQGDLQAAIGRYATTATGGAGVGPRRFGSMARAGGALFDALAALGTGQSVPNEPRLNIQDLNGQDTDVVIDLIIQVLSTEDGDADRVRVAMNEALAECLQGYEEFDFTHIDDEMLVRLMLAYVSRCVFEQIVLDSNEAFGKGTIEDIEIAERDLLMLIEATTNRHMRPLLVGNVRGLVGQDIVTAQLNAITEVWREWEEYVQ